MTSSAIALSLSVRTAFDEAGEDFDIQIRPSQAKGIRLRVRVYLEGALERGAGESSALALFMLLQAAKIPLQR